MNNQKNKELWLNKVKQTLEIGGKSKNTYNNYKSHITKFLNHYDNTIIISNLNECDIADYIYITYIKKDLSSSTLNVAICSIRFLFAVCFKKTLIKDLLPSSKMTKKLPIFISKDLFIQIFNNEKSIKFKCFLLLAFCSGLRVSEIATLKIEHVYSAENKLKVLGKRKKERFTILPNITIKYLRIYYKESQIKDNTGYLFKGASNSRKDHINPKSISNWFNFIKRQYNLNKNISFHSLRHSFATYFLRNGGDLLMLKFMLGHNHLMSTSIYVHLSNDFTNVKGINCE